MNMKINKKVMVGITLFSLIFSLTGCSNNTNTTNTSLSNVSNETILSKSDIFTSRDLEQIVDTSEATNYTVSDNTNITITEEGTYVISGYADNVTIIVDATDEDKIDLVLDNLTIENASTPCIYVENADKVFISLVENSSLIVTGSFTSDGTTNTDAVIFSKDDLVIKGTGTLVINSTDNGITSKDDLKITGGTINITSSNDALEANNAIAIADGNITINSKKDGLHAEYDEDTSKGYIYISGGNLNVTASDDAIHATTTLVIDGGTIDLNAREGLEATYVQINDGVINISASDDAINAGAKSNSYTPTIEINGGSLTIKMGQGDTDGIDSNGNLYINGGTINITGNSPFDYDGEAKYTGGTIIVNGEKTNTITNQMMGGRGGNMGGSGGNRGGYRKVR